MRKIFVIIVSLWSTSLFCQSNGYTGGIPISSTPIAGDVTGTLGSTVVKKIQGDSVSVTNPTLSQILKWNGSAWVPTKDSIGTGVTYTAGTGISLGSNVITNTLPEATTVTDGTTIDFTKTSNDITGEVKDASLVLSKLNQTSATSGQVVKWNGTIWAPGTDNNTGTTYTAGTGIAISGGNVISNTGDNDNSSTNEIQQIDTFAVQSGNLKASLSLDGVPAKSIAVTTIAPVQSVAAGTGISVSPSSGTYTVTNTGDLSSTNEIQQIDTFNITSNTLNLSLSQDGVPKKTVSLAAYLDNTDSQNLSVSGGNLNISGGTGVAVTAIAPLQTIAAGTGITFGGSAPNITINSSGINLYNADGTLTGNRTLTLGGNSLSFAGSSVTSSWSAAGNYGLSSSGFTPLNKFHILVSGTSGTSGSGGNGITLTGNMSSNPGIFYENPDATTGNRVWETYATGSTTSLWKLAKTADNGSTPVDVLTANSSGQIGIGKSNQTVSLDVGGTDAIRIPSGTTSNRPTAAQGMFRYNTTLGFYEGFDGTNWVPFRPYSIKYAYGHGAGVASSGITNLSLSAASIAFNAGDILSGTAFVKIIVPASSGTQTLSLELRITGSNSTVYVAARNQIVVANSGSPVTYYLRLNNIKMAFDTDGGNYYATGSYDKCTGITNQQCDTYIVENLPSTGNDKLNIGSNFPIAYTLVATSTAAVGMQIIQTDINIID